MSPTIPVSGALADQASSVTIPASGAYTAGDRRYVAITVSSGPTVNTLTGWTKTLDFQVGTSSLRRCYLFEQVAVGSDPAATFTFTGTTHFSATYWAVRGGLSTIIGPTAGQAETGTALTAAGQTTTVTDSLLIALFCSLNSSSSIANTLPAGMSSAASAVPAGTGHVARLAYEVRPTTGATGTRTSTAQVSSRWATISMAVSPSGLADPLWVGDAETGDFSQLSDPAGGIDQLSPQTRAVVTTPTRAGVYAFEFAVNGTNTTATPDTQRSEGRAQGLVFSSGDDRWIGGSIRVPSGFPTSPGAFQVVMQLKADVDGTPPVTLNIESGQLQMQGGFGRPAGSSPMPAKTLVASLAAGVWYDVLLHVKFSADPAVGEVTAWVNGVEVLAPYKPPGGTMYAGVTSYFKIGLYRSPSLATSTATRVYHDEWRVGTTRAAVELSGTTVLAAAALSGAGTLSGAVRQTHSVVAALSGAGTLSGAVRQTHSVTAALSGAAGLALSASTSVPAAAALGGTGSLSATAGRGQSAVAALSGAGSLSATVGPSASATLDGSGTVTAALVQTHQISAVLDASGTVTAGTVQTHQITAALTAAATLGAGAARDQPAGAALTAAATLGGAGTRVRPLAGHLTGTLTVTAAATRSAPAAAALTATATLTGTAAGTAAGVLNVSVWAVDPDGGALTALPGWTKLSISMIRNTPGAVSLSYPVAARGFATLRAGVVTGDRDLEIEIWLGGRQSTRLRAILDTDAGDDVDPAGMWTFSGSFLERLLADAIVYDQPAAEKRELRFVAATPGAVVSTLLTQAQTRGALTGMTRDFTNLLDSSGQPWPEFVTIKFSPGAGYLAVLQRLVELNLLDFEVTPARVLRCWAPGRAGTDRTLGATPTVIRRGRNITEAPHRHSVRDSITAVLAAGADGIYAQAVDATAQARRGRRVEGYVSAANLTDLGAVQAYGGKTLAARTPGERELTLGLAFGVGHPRPGQHFAPSDWVYVDSAGTLERLRVVQVTVEVDAAGPTGSVTVNDLRTDWRIRAERRLNALADGDVVIGTSTQAPGDDTVAPGVPVGITVGSTAYLNDAGAPLASVQVGWTPPTSNADGTALFDLAGFRARYRLSSPTWETTPDVAANTTQLSISDVEAGAGIEVQVAAFDRDLNQSAWSVSATHTTESDLTAPPVPSTPDVSPYLGQLRIAWDGFGQGGAPMSLDLDRVEVHVSTVNNFPPSDTTLVDQFAQITGERVVTDLTYGVVHYVRLVAVDTSGNRSGPSAVASGTPGKVVGDDVFAGAIGTAQLAELAVTTAKINLLAVNDAQIGNLSVGKLTAGTLTALVTLSGMFRTAATGKRMEIDGNGWRAYLPDGTTRFAELNMTTATFLMTGTYKSALSGERIEMPADGTLRWYGTGSDYAEAANDGGIVRFRSRADTSGRRSFVELNPAGVSMYYGSTAGDYTGARSGLDTGLTYSVMRGPVTGVRCLTQFAPADGTQSRFHVVFASGSGDLGPSVFHFLRASSGRGILIGASADAGIKPEGGVLEIVKGSGMTFAPARAESFLVGSGLATKGEVMPVRARLGVRAVDVTRLAPARAWRRNPAAAPPRPDRPGHKLRRTGPDGAEVWVDAEWDWDELPRPVRFGPIAEDLAAISPALVQRMHDGALVLDLGSMAGIAWAAAADNADDLDTLRVEVETLRARLDGRIVDGEVG